MSRYEDYDPDSEDHPLYAMAPVDRKDMGVIYKAWKEGKIRIYKPYINDMYELVDHWGAITSDKTEAQFSRRIADIAAYIRQGDYRKAQRRIGFMTSAPGKKPLDAGRLQIKSSIKRTSRKSPPKKNAAKKPEVKKAVPKTAAKKQIGKTKVTRPIKKTSRKTVPKSGGKYTPIKLIKR